MEGNESVLPKLFHPVSAHGIKQIHMDIDAEIMYYLLKDIGIEILKNSTAVDGRNINSPIFVRGRLHLSHFNKYFSIKQLESKNKGKVFNYSNGISTDGVSISMLLKKDELIKAGKPTRRKKEYRHLSGKSILGILLLLL